MSEQRERERCYIGRYATREQAERISARYGDSAYPNRTVEPEEVGGRTDWLIWCDREPTARPDVVSVARVGTSDPVEGGR